MKTIYEQYEDYIERTVKRLARDFRFKGYDYEDLEQEGRIAAFKCCEKYNPAEVPCFEAYLFTSVKNRLHDFLYRCSGGHYEAGTVPTSRRIVNERVPILERRLGRMPTPEEVHQDFVNEPPIVNRGRRRRGQVYHWEVWTLGRIRNVMESSQTLRPLSIWDLDYWEEPSSVSFEPSVLDSWLIEKFFEVCTPLQIELLKAVSEGDLPDDLMKRYGCTRPYLWNQLYQARRKITIVNDLLGSPYSQERRTHIWHGIKTKKRPAEAAAHLNGRKKKVEKCTNQETPAPRISKAA